MNENVPESPNPQPSAEGEPNIYPPGGGVDVEFIVLATELIRQKMTALEDAPASAAQVSLTAEVEGEAPSIKMQIEQILRDINTAVNPSRFLTIVCPIVRPKCSTCEPAYIQCLETGGTNCSSKRTTCKNCCVP